MRVTPPGTDPTLDLQAQLIAFIRAFGLHRPDQTPCGQPVSVAEAHALMELDRRAPLSQTELAQWLRLEKSTVSRLVAQLERRGWVERCRDPRDGRAVQLHLTTAGRNTANALSEARRAKFARLLAAIPVSEHAAVMRTLDILTEALNDHSH